MSDFIRGGQVTFHKFRMLMQVSKVMARISLLLIILSIGYTYYKHINLNEWQIGFSLIKREFLLLVGKDKAKLTYSNQYGIDKTIAITEFNKEPYVVKTIEKFNVVFYKSLIVTSIMLAIIVGGLLIFFWFKGANIKSTHKLRGVFLLTVIGLKRKLKTHNKQFKKYKPFKIAGFSYPISGRVQSWTSGEQSHTLILGSTGAGKTKIIQALVYQVHKRNQKAIIVDIKGDYIKSFYRRNRGDIILNPLDIRGKNWSIFKETTELKGFSGIAKSLLPQGSKNDPIWSEAARGVFCEMANLYWSSNLSLNEFANKILKTDLNTLAKLLDKTLASKIINTEIEKAALSVLMVLATYLRPLKLYRSSEQCFSITDWINDSSQNNFLFISSRADIKEDLNPIITTQVDIAINALRSLKEESNQPKIWFILDELAYFDQGIPSLKEGLATVRSYGGCFVLGAQDMSSLAKIYSDKTAESIANNCRTKLFMNVEGKESAQWCSNALGDGEIDEWHEGLSYGSHEMRDGINVNRNRTIKRLVLPSEFSMLKTGEGYIKFAGFESAKFNTKDVYFKTIASSFEENPELYLLFRKDIEEAEKRRQEIEEELAKQSGKLPKEIQKQAAKKQAQKPKAPETTPTNIKKLLMGRGGL